MTKITKRVPPGPPPPPTQTVLTAYTGIEWYIVCDQDYAAKFLGLDEIRFQFGRERREEEGERKRERSSSLLRSESRHHGV